jgi:hypothetical protein
VRFCDCAGLSLFLRLLKRANAAGDSLHPGGTSPGGPSAHRSDPAARPPADPDRPTEVITLPG